MILWRAIIFTSSAKWLCFKLKHFTFCSRVILCRSCHECFVCIPVAGQVRDGQLAQYNFILVVGAQEVEERSVNVRTRDNEVGTSFSAVQQFTICT